jgi:inorganic triphosphatase YgiF
VAEVALDDTRIIGHGSVIGEFKRVEVEALGEGSWQPLLPSFVAALAADLGLEQASASKFESGLEAAGLTPATSLDLGPTVAAPDAPADEFALAILRRCFGLLVAREPGTRLGEDEEELHQMRVTLRACERSEYVQGSSAATASGITR